eukprot:TRINITY_DN3344_c0_g1_i2.p1 TRINITY_DN3344_c0_g1~~TRINITY_DN3344_c0_g1_i2.p1  ORF type:complete len:124 (-),score=16.83 TRINITY_DN3344_c0_g1_i2:40-411(-)
MHHSETIIVKKSKFYGHCCKIETVEDTILALDALKNSKKRIFNATHNIVAYRLRDKLTNEIHEFRDDDGESGAGDKMLFLLQQMNEMDIWVCVTREYGGILLGPSRFKYINLSCKNVIELLKS